MLWRRFARIFGKYKNLIKTMDENELLKERFKSAVSSAVKAISENFDLEIKFGNSTSSKKNELNLPDIINLKKLEDFTNLRAFADSEALKIKYTNSKIYSENEPDGSMAKALYAIAENIRYVKIGCKKCKKKLKKTRKIGYFFWSRGFLEKNPKYDQKIEFGHDLPL